MDNLLLYLLKVSAVTTILYLSYLLFFSWDTFYRRNRALLILTLILPIFLPAIKIPVVIHSTVPVEPVSAIDNIILSGTAFDTVSSGAATSFDYYRLITWIYLILAGLMLLKGAISVLSTFRIIKKGEVKDNRFPKVIISDAQVPPFSFFPYAVIPEDEYNNGNYRDILDHEFAHIRQGHTFDLLLSELFIAFQWFNPFVWLIKRSIILNHEYLADRISFGNKSAKEYQYRLLGFQTELKHISLAHNFNSLIKNRIIMINKKPTHKYAITKNLLILPIVAVIAYAFATPEYRYISEPQKDNSITIIQSPAIVQQQVKGIVLSEDGKPLSGVLISNTGAVGDAFGTETGSDGKFSFDNIKSDAYLMFSYRGYKRQSLKPVFGAEMVVKMEIDPTYKPQPVAVMAANGATQVSGQRPQPIIAVDGVISGKSLKEVIKDLGYDMGIAKMLTGKEATDKYGEKGANGVYEITTRKKALAMGLKPIFPRLAPTDYPTFQNQKASSFTEWIISHLKYPPEAKAKNVEGWVQLNFRVELDGSITNIVSSIPVDKNLSDEVIKVVQSAPKWDQPKNKNVDEPYNTNITMRFKLPDQVLNEAPYVVVQEMPNYPGGDKELMKFINENIKYPEEAKAEKIQGRVILRFVINTEGKTEAISVLKGVNPELDAEAVRVISLLKGWTPGMQGDKLVNVWYAIPVTFSLDAKQIDISPTSMNEFYRFIMSNIVYPQQAKESSDTGRIYVVIKLNKGGITKECKVIENKNTITVPVLEEVVTVGYKPTGNTNASSSVNTVADGHLALKNECLRVVNLLTVNEIPEWNDKDIEFALAFNFMLK